MFRAMTMTLTVGVAASAGLAQTGTLDQNSPMQPGAGSAGFNLDATFLIWQAQIKPGVAGQLEGIRVTLTGDAGATANFRVRRGAAWNSGAAEFEALVTKQITGTELVFIDMTASNITLAAGEVFVMESQGTGTGCGINGSYVAPPGTPLYSEPLFLNNSNFADGGWRHGFETFMLSGSTCYPDCNDSGTLTLADFGCFQGKYVLGDLYADCNESGNLTVADFGCFQGKYVIGCP